jgi:hypothetical protein
MLGVGERERRDERCGRACEWWQESKATWDEAMVGVMARRG